MMIEMSTAVCPMNPENMRVMTMMATMTARPAGCARSARSGVLRGHHRSGAGLNSA